MIFIRQSLAAFGFFVLGVLASGPLNAHEGHSDAPVAVRVTQSGLLATVVLENTSHIPVEIVALSSDHGPLMGPALPFYLLGGAEARFTLSFDSARLVPGLFSIFLDLGTQGAGPLLVVPDLR